MMQPLAHRFMYRSKLEYNPYASHRVARGERSESHDKIQRFERVIAKDATPSLYLTGRPLAIADYAGVVGRKEVAMNYSLAI